MLVIHIIIAPPPHMYQSCELAQQMVRVYRKNLIERSFKSSAQHAYSMPRVNNVQSDGESQQIPNIYDLYSQNKKEAVRTTKIISVKQLAELQLKHSIMTVKLQSQSKAENNSYQTAHSAKITRTLNKNYPKMTKQRLPLMLCCEKDQQLDKYETQQKSDQQPQRSPNNQSRPRKNLLRRIK